MKKRFLLPLIFIASLQSFEITAQAVGDYRSNSAAAFNWNVDASWQRWNGGAWADPTVGGFGYPGENATGIAGTVTIQAGHSVRANVDVTTNDLGNLIVNGTLNMNTDNVDIDITGNVTVPGGGVFIFDGDDLTLDIGGSLTLLGNGIMDMNDNNQDINVAGNLLMDGTSDIQGNNNTQNIHVTGTFTVPATATNARIGGVTLTIDAATTVPGTLVLYSNTGVKTFTGRVTVSGSWTSTAITTNNRLVFGGEVLTSGVFACGCN